MRAYSTASGGVVFVPETINRKDCSKRAAVSYSDLTKAERPDCSYADSGRPLTRSDGVFDAAADNLMRASF